MPLITINPDTTLDGFLLKDALVAMYNMFSAVLGRTAASDNPEYYRKEIPEMVFDAAVGAGWFDFVDEVPWKPVLKDLPDWVRQIRQAAEQRGDGDPPRRRFKKNEAQRLVQCGEFYVDRAIVDGFYGLLAEAIAFHLADVTLHEERLKSLPKVTTTRQRAALLKQYVARHKAEVKAVKMTEIAKNAGVDYSVLTKWKNGKILDSADPAQRISLLLRFDEASRARPYRKLLKH
jgi:hypothetical protein